MSGLEAEALQGYELLAGLKTLDSLLRKWGVELQTSGTKKSREKSSEQELDAKEREL